MTRLLYNPLRLILFVNAFSTGLTNGLNLEEQIKQLRENFVRKKLFFISLQYNIIEYDSILFIHPSKTL